MRRRITLGVIMCPHFGLLQGKTDGLQASWGFGCHSVPLTTADVQALACSAFECPSVKLNGDGHEILYAQK